MSVMTQPGPPSGAGPAAPHLRAKSRPGETAILVVLRLAAITSVAITIGIIVALISPALDFFSQVPIGEFLSTSDSGREGVRPAVLPLLWGTMLTTIVALAIAVPIGLGAAMYLSEYASKRARKILKPTVELLAGVPSVVYGFFALTFVTPVVLNDWLGLKVSLTNSLGAGLVLGVMIIPTIASLSEDAFSAVPQALRQGSLAMGANRRQTTVRVVFPAALSGVAAAIVLGLSRAVGETMIVALAAGSTKSMSFDIGAPHQSMTAFIAQTAGGENPPGTPAYNMLFAVALLLFILTFIMNLASVAIVRRFRQEY